MLYQFLHIGVTKNPNTDLPIGAGFSTLYYTIITIEYIQYTIIPLWNILYCIISTVVFIQYNTSMQSNVASSNSRD